MGDFELTQIEPLFRRLLTLFSNPSSNLPAALLLYGILVLIVLLVVVVAIMVVMGTPEDDEEAEAAEAAYVAGGVQAGEYDGSQPEERRFAQAFSLPVVLVLVLVIWVLAGYMTASSDICRGCHVRTVHGEAASGTDPHASADCVTCHEPYGTIGRYTTALPARVLHFAGGIANRKLLAGYGGVSNSACLSCHEAVLSGVTLDKKTGVRMSHVEPLAASATCLDCHAAYRGAVTARTVGMNPCLRCHEGKAASAKCTTCHDGKTSAAARARSASEPRQLVAQVNCGGCHDQQTECDTCHGTRMPHTVAFKAGGHARAAAVDFWYNGGNTCKKCHTATRRPCQKCHGALLGRGHPASNSYTHTLVKNAAGCGCHQQWASTPSRDFCKDVCHQPEQIKESPR